MSKQAYQVILYAGGSVPTVEGVSVVDITPLDSSLEGMIAAIKGAELTAADLRAKTLLVLGEIEVEVALKLYSLVLGFAGRRINISVDGEIIDAASINHLGVISKDLGKPDEVLEIFHLEKENFTSKRELTIEEVTDLRYARKCILTNKLSLKDTLELFIKASGFRVRNNGDHLPSLTATKKFEGVEDGMLIDLNEYRKVGNELRRLVKTDNRGAIVEGIESSERDEMLEKAAKLPIEIALLFLGSYADESGELWRCPRPERHRNGDLNPSMKINEEKVRCYRCDLEAIDAVRLIMDSLEITPDEASKIILAELI